jgi:hypothetical protein
MISNFRTMLCVGLSLGTLALNAAPFDYPVIEDKAVNAIRVAGVMDPKADHEDDPILGFEVGVGSNDYPIDEMILAYGHLEADDINHSYVVFALEERWDIYKNIRPYGTAGVGYLWTDDKSGYDADGIYGKLGAGILIAIAPKIRAYAEVEWQYSSADLWLEDGQFTNSNMLGVAGLRFYY